MKIRTGFVSNSSSSSYIIKKNNLTEQQLYMIKNHISYCYDLLKKKLDKPDSFRKFTNDDPFGEENWDERDEDMSVEVLKGILHLDWGNGEYAADKGDKWHILKEDENIIHLGTNMDNFDLHWFLINVAEVDAADIEWVDY